MSGVNLAIETSVAAGSLTLGRGDRKLETVSLERGRRHNLELMPGVEALFARHGLGRDALEEVYVSLGPGSFTGLRIAIATVKMLALARGARVVGVPTVEAAAQRAPEGAAHVAVGLNLKRGTLYSQHFARGEGGALEPVSEARLRSIEAVLAEAARPVTLIGETLPALPASAADDARLTVITGEAARPESEAVWRLGRARARTGLFDEPAALLPHYGREPEAVTLWREQQGT